MILGNAIRKLDLPREELVIMTKVAGQSLLSSGSDSSTLLKLHLVVAPEHGMVVREDPDRVGLVNQYGSNRKVMPDRPTAFDYMLLRHN